MSQLPASGCWQHHTTALGHLLYLLQTSSVSMLACKIPPRELLVTHVFFQPLPKHFTMPWFFRGTFLFHCHSETWSGASPQATRVNRVWLTGPLHRPDHLGYMLMCPTGRERLEIQVCVADVQIILAPKSSNRYLILIHLWEENVHYIV